MIIFEIYVKNIPIFKFQNWPLSLEISRIAGNREKNIKFVLYAHLISGRSAFLQKIYSCVARRTYSIAHSLVIKFKIGSYRQKFQDTPLLDTASEKKLSI